MRTGHICGMVGKDQNEFAKPRYSYAQVEGALARVFGADAKVQRGAFRGRIKHFQRLGLPGLNVGKGAKITYSYEQACQWLVALLMSEIGFDPTVTVKVIEDYWSDRNVRLATWIRRATDAEALAEKNSVHFKLTPRLMSGSWAKRPLGTLPWIGMFRRFDLHLKDARGRPIPRENVSNVLDRAGDDGWLLCCINLTDRVVRLEQELGIRSK
jgi:hypothetical protein